MNNVDSDLKIPLIEMMQFSLSLCLVLFQIISIRCFPSCYGLVTCAQEKAVQPNLKA